MTKKKKPPRSKRKPADLRFKIRCCFIQGARMVSKKKGEGREKRRMEGSLEEGKRSILRNSRRTREFSLSRITDFDILRGARRTNIAAKDR